MSEGAVWSNLDTKIHSIYQPRKISSHQPTPSKWKHLLPMSHIPTISIVLSSISATAAGTVLLSYASMKQRPKLADPSSMIVFLTLSDLALAIIGCFLSRTGWVLVYVYITHHLHFFYVIFIFTLAFKLCLFPDLGFRTFCVTPEVYVWYILRSAPHYGLLQCLTLAVLWSKPYWEVSV